MRFSDLKGVACRAVELGPVDWTLAHLLGEARQASKRHISHGPGDRGAKGNVHVYGALGELTLFRTVGSLEGSEEAKRFISRHHYNSAGGGELHGPDLEFEDDDAKRLFRIDSKTFGCLPYKRLIVI